MFDLRSADSSDAARAFLYASGELEGTEAAAFEQRLGTEQAARESLCQAVQLLHALGVQAQPGLSPTCRAEVRRRLRAGRAPWWRRLSRPCPYRGHPALWASLGAVAAVAALWAAPADLLPFPCPQPPDQVSQSEHKPAAPANLDDELAIIETAERWADLPSSDHLARARQEEERRRSRAEDHHLVHTEDRELNLFGPRTSKH